MLALVCLCAQNSVLVLSMRYTRSVLNEKYLSSSVVVMMEVLKFIFSYAMCAKDGGHTRSHHRIHPPHLTSSPQHLTTLLPVSSLRPTATLNDIMGQPDTHLVPCHSLQVLAQLLTPPSLCPTASSSHSDLPPHVHPRPPLRRTKLPPTAGHQGPPHHPAPPHPPPPHPSHTPHPPPPPYLSSPLLPPVQHLDASAFSILSQLKILTTAVCSVIMLGTHLSPRKWRALGLLVIGAILVQFPSSSSTTGHVSTFSVTGLTAVLAMVSLSGIAGIYLEKFLKNKTHTVGAAVAPTQLSLWERNLQLSLYGIIFAVATAAYQDREAVQTLGFFYGFSYATWVVIVAAAGGGLIVAVVVKYTNTIVKGFATSISIIVTSLLSLALFPEVDLSLLFWLGTACVLISIFNYNEEDAVKKANQSPQLNGKAGEAAAYKRMMSEELMGGTTDSGEEEGEVEMSDVQAHLLRNGSTPAHR